jgi:DNA-binding NarL/FixJ family response regulator
MNSTRILLADDHTLVRAGIRSLLEQLSGIEVVAEADDGREALKKIKTHHPDVALIDVAMPEMNGIEAATRIAREFPHTRVIILSMHATEEYVLQALRAGAVGYLLKDASPAELELAVRSASRGETYLTPAVSKHVIEKYVHRAGGVSAEAGKDEPPVTPFEVLTPRQREVLQLIAEGRSTKEIAQTLNLSVKTVETHRAQLMQRLDIHDVAGLVRYAIRVGVVKME